MCAICVFELDVCVCTVCEIVDVFTISEKWGHTSVGKFSS